MFKKSCRKEILVSTPYGTICRCPCGTFYVRMGEMNICFPTYEFEELARLFKLSLGMISAEKLAETESNPFWKKAGRKRARGESTGIFYVKGVSV